MLEQLNRVIARYFGDPELPIVIPLSILIAIGLAAMVLRIVIDLRRLP